MYLHFGCNVVLNGKDGAFWAIDGLGVRHTSIWHHVLKISGTKYSILS